MDKELVGKIVTALEYIALVILINGVMTMCSGAGKPSLYNTEQSLGRIADSLDTISKKCE